MAEPTDDPPYQALYRRFRPSSFAEVRGQDHVVLALRNSVRDGRVAHAYLFSGPRGTGKTSTARILAKALNCTDLHDGEPCGVCVSCIEITKGTSLDVHELDAASNNGVEAMRDLVSHAALGTPGRQKVYIVDEVHMLSTAASNALLKTLEEPPSHVVFVLATTDPQKVLPTIRSRTQHFEFRLLGQDTLGDLLDQVREDAGLELTDAAIDLAVRRGRGSARDALSVLDQVLASDEVEDDLPEVDEIVEALAERDVSRAMVAVAHLTAAGFSPQQLAVDLVDRLRQGFLSLVAPELVADTGSPGDPITGLADRVGLAALVRATETLGRAQVAMRDSPDPRVNLEVALVRLAHPEADDSPEALLTRIERLEAAAGPRGADRPASRQPPPLQAPEPAVGAVDEGPVAEPVAAPTEVATGRPTTPTMTLGAVRRRSLPNSAPREELPPEPAVASAASRLLEEPAPTPAGGPVSLPSRDELVQAWGDHVIGRLRPKAKALYQAGRFVGVDGDRALFGLPNEIHRERCEELRGEIETALSSHFGSPIGLTLVVDAGATADPVAPPVRSGGRARPPSGEPVPGESPTGADDEAEPIEELLDVDNLEIADVDTSAEARLREAFPGAEEVG